MAIDAERKLNHFKFWKVGAKTFNPAIAVQLQGQFEQVRLPYDVKDLVWIGNPVKKFSTGKDVPHGYIEKLKSLHLLGYTISPKDATPANRWVRISNQLQTIDKAHRTEDPNFPTWMVVGDPSHLLVPAAKLEVSQPQPAEKAPPPKLILPKPAFHFACYPIKTSADLKVKLELEDQFDVNWEDPQKKKGREEISFAKPALFCVPVNKKKGDKPEERIPCKDSTESDMDLPHLILYAINTHNRFGKAWVRDQFHDDAIKVDVEHSIYLGVPTDKTGISLTEPGKND